MYKKLLALAAIMAFVLAAGAALAQEKEPYFITIEDVSQAIGVGPIWGQGVITYGDKTHLFKVKGFDKFEVGREKLSVDGDVYHLKTSRTWPESTTRPIQPASLSLKVKKIW